MKKKRIILIKTSPIERDNRLLKEIGAMKRGGYLVSLLCWDRVGKRPPVVSLPVEAKPENVFPPPTNMA